MSHDAHAPTTITETVTVQTAVDDPAATTTTTTAPRTSLLAVAGAELFGTFLFVFVGLGAALYATTQGLSTFEVALAYGIALMGALAAVGHVSGGHFNPAVTLGSTLAGRTSWKRLPAYWGAQVVGAVAGAAALFAALPASFASESSGFATLRDFFSTTANGYGVHSAAYRSAETAFYAPYLAQGFPRDQVDEAIAAGQLAAPTLPTFDTVEVVIFEVVLTALFVGVFLAVTDRRVRSRMVPVVLGLSFAALLVVATPMSNGSLNPARSVAAAVFSDGWAFSQLWVFLVAPLAGAAIAALFYRGFASGPTALSVAVATGMRDEIAVEEEAADAEARDELFDRSARKAGTTDDDAEAADQVDGTDEDDEDDEDAVVAESAEARSDDVAPPAATEKFAPKTPVKDSAKASSTTSGEAAADGPDDAVADDAEPVSDSSADSDDSAGTDDTRPTGGSSKPS